MNISPNNGPPLWMLRILRSFCPSELLEEIEGDLVQRFRRHSKTLGERRAKIKLFWSVIYFFRPGILLRNHLSLNTTTFYMFANYFKIALRIMTRSKSFTIINLTGLALGITAALLLFLWINHEFSYDRFHVNKNRLHIAWNRVSGNGQLNCSRITPRVLAPTLEGEFALVEEAVSFAKWESTHLFTAGQTKLLKSTGAFTDPAFLTILSFPLLKGDQSHALENPSSIVLTEEFAHQLFGDKDAFGEVVSLSQDGYSFEFNVSGILKSLPGNTEFDFEYLIPFSFLESLDGKDQSWGNNSVRTIVMLKEGTDLNDINEQIRSVEKKHFADGQHVEIFLYPLIKSRLYSRFENGVPSGGRIEIISLIGALGICLVIIASINFVNLSTARAQRRSREVAVRKITGAARYSLISQFLLESILMAIFAGAIAMAACFFALPFFNTLVRQDIPFETIPVKFWSWYFASVLFIGVLAGSYPAFYLSSFASVPVLKGSHSSGSKGAILRSILVVFQFGFAITFITSAIVIYRQIDFLRNRDAGYSRDNLVYLSLNGDLKKNYEALKNELVSRDLILSATRTSNRLTQRWSGSTEMVWPGKESGERSNVERIYMDKDIIKTCSLILLQGRDIDLTQFPADSTAVLINQAAMQLMGLRDPIGEIIVDNGQDWRIVGVVKDFVFTSPYKKVEPVVLFGPKGSWAFEVMYMKLNPARSIEESLVELSRLSAKYNPAYPFEYHFADEEYQQKFNDLRAAQTIANIFTVIAIFIACLGLLGLAFYMTEVRRKEIGIRKVLGGTVFAITRLLSMSSLKPILLSIVIFTPLSWFIMRWSLESFAYHPPLNPWICLVAAFAILMIATITIASQTIRASLNDPVDSLRSE